MHYELLWDVPHERGYFKSNILPAEYIQHNVAFMATWYYTGTVLKGTVKKEPYCAD